MKKHLTQRVITCLAVAACTIMKSYAATLFWSANGSTAGGAGTWNTNFNTPPAQWSLTSGSGYTRYWTNANNDIATLEGTSGAIALTNAITANGIVANVSGYSFTGASGITFAGSNPTINVTTNSGWQTGILTISCPYLGSGVTLNKTGPGRLELNNSASSGGIGKYNVTAGFLGFATPNRFGAAPSSVTPDFITLNGGGLANTFTAGSLSVNQGITIGSGGGYFGGTAAAATTVASRITGTGSVFFTTGLPLFGASTGASWVLTNPTNDWAGSTTISGITLTLGASEVIPNASAVTVSASGTLAMGGAGTNETVGAVTVSGGTISGSGILTGSSYAFQSGTVSAVLAGTAAATKSTSGSIDLTAANTYTGGTAINAGKVRVNNNAALGAANSTVTLANGVTNSVTAGTARTLTYAWTVNGNQFLGESSGGTGVLTLGGTMDLGSTAHTFNILNAADTISAVISGTGGITLGSSNTLTLSGANTFSGALTLTSGGTLSLGNNRGSGTGPLNLNGGTMNITASQNATNAMANATTLNADTTIQGGATGTTAVTARHGGTWTTTAGTLSLRNPSSTGTFDFLVTNSFTFSQPIVIGLSGDTNNPCQFSVFNDSTAGDQVFNGVISGYGTVRRSATSAGGTAIFNKANTYSGGTTINAGTIGLGDDAALGSGAVTLGGSQAIGLFASGGSRTIANNITHGNTSSGGLTISGANDLTLTGTFALGSSGRTLTVNNGKTTISGVVSGTAAATANGLTKAGTGTLVLANANSYTGNTLVNAGTLKVLSSGATGAGTNTISVGATLSGNGTVGTVVLNGNISPGDGIGTLTTGDEVWGAGATNTIEISDVTGSLGVGIDYLSIGGTLTINATVANPVVVDLTSLTTGGAAGDVSNFDASQTYSWVIAHASSIVGYTPDKFVVKTAHFSNALNGGGFGISTNGNGDLILSFATPPSITTQPQSINANVGDSIQFSVDATGTTPLQYQWKKNGIDISGATASAYAISPATGADAAAYTVFVYNVAGGQLSSAANLTVNVSITSQPASVVRDPGASATFSVAADGQTPITYQWKKDGVNISGANLTSFSIGTVHGVDSGNYSVGVSNAVSGVVSVDAALNVTPEILLQPADASTNTGSITLTVGFAGTPPFSAQWRKASNNLVDDVRIYGSLTNLVVVSNQVSLTISNVNNTDSGNYDVVIANGYGSVTSSIAVVTIKDPAVVTDPSSMTVNAGQTATFSVVAAGSGTLGYQWYKGASALVDGGTISGATSTVLTISNAQQSDAGTYSVVVTNASGTDTSATATLTVIDPPVVTQAPARADVGVGSNAVFSVAYSGSVSTLRWSRNGTNITDNAKYSGSTTTSLTVNGVTHADEGTFTVGITNAAGFAVTTGVALAAYDAPAVTVSPTSRIRATGTNTIFSVTATGTSPQYQWKKTVAAVTTDVVDDSRISGSQASSLTIGNLGAADDADYFVVVTNVAGSATSSPATLTVIDGPSITSQPQSLTVTNTNPASFSVVAVGGETISYQWKKNGANISGANASSYSIASAALTDAGAYTVVVSNAADVVTSSAATLTVLQAPAITTQPSSVTIGAGSAAAFTVTATGNPLAYQWALNGSAIAGATNSSLTVSNAQSANVGYYNVTVSNIVGTVTSANANLALTTITLFSDKLDANTSANWVTNQVGTDNRATWAFDYSTVGVPQAPGATSTKALKLEANLTNATIESIDLSPKGKNFTGDYQVRFYAWQNAVGSFPGGGVGSTEAITAGMAVSATKAHHIEAGSGADGFWIEANGDAQAAQTYKYPDYGVFVGTTFQNSNSGVYASGTGGLAMDAGDTYYSSKFPARTAPSAQTTLFATQTGSEVAGSFGFAWHEVVLGRIGNIYTWSIDGIRIASVTNSSLTGTNIFIGYLDPFAGSCTATNVEFGLFYNVRVEVTNAAGIAPTIATQPASRTNNAGTTATFTVSASGTGTLRYQWQKNGVPISGATTSTLSVPNVSGASAGNYRVLVFTDSSYLASSDAVLTVIDPFISAQPVNRSTNAGSAVTFSVTATGTGPFTYQWQKDGANVSGANITGANSTTLTVGNTRNADEGAYSVVVTGASGSIISSNATLTVQDPVITSSPSSLLKVAGGTATFNVTAIGTALTYQWKKDGFNVSDDTRISGSSASTLTIANLSNGDMGSYSAVVTGPDGSVTSGSATLTIIDGVAITTQPVSITNNANTTATFAVTATGGGTLVYQWKRAGTNLVNNAQFGGVNTASLTVSNVFAADATNYVVLVSNEDSAVLSSDAILTVIDPYISTNPVAVTTGAGSNAVFAVSAVGTSPVTYQWKKDGANLNDVAGHVSGAQSSVLTITGAVDADAASYSVTVSNALGVAATSSGAALTVIDPPAIQIIPNVTVNNGQSAVFTAVVSGTAPFQYSWTKNGTPLANGGNVSGATTGSLTIAGTTQSDVATYAVTATNIAGSATSSATLTVIDPPSITSGPDAVTVNVTGTATLNVTAGGSAATYSWQKDGVTLSDGVTTSGSVVSGATTATLTIANAQHEDQGNYTALLVNAAGNATSTAAALTVAEPYIITQPQNANVNLAASTALSVVATSSYSATNKFQWYFKGSSASAFAVLPKATNATLALNNASLAVGGNYFVVISNKYSAVTSSVATVTVFIAPTVGSQPKPLPTATVQEGQTAYMFVVAKGTAPQYFWKKDGSFIPGANAATYTISRASIADTGSYSCVISNQAGNVESAAAVLTVISDATIPKVAIVAPKSKSDQFTSTITATGTAADTARIVDVQYSLNGSAWQSVGTFSPITKPDGNVYAATWSTVLTPAVGTNVLQAKAIDYKGNASLIASSMFYYDVPSTLTVAIDGHDTRAGEGPGSYIGAKQPTMIVAPDIYVTNNAQLYVNRGPYLITAVPGVNQIFTNWTVGGTEVSTNAKYNFVMQTDLALTANFIHNPYIEAAGIYNGLVTNTANDYGIDGSVSFKIDAKQVYSATLFIDGDKLAASGKLSVPGTASTTISRAKLGKSNLKLDLAVIFAANAASGTNEIHATLTDLGPSGKTAGMTAYQSVYGGPNISPYAGQYTMVLDNSSTEAGGFGYGLVTISTNGAVTIAGGLGDSAALKIVTTVSKDGRIPFYSALYAGKLNYTNTAVVPNVIVPTAVNFGSIMGWLQVTNATAIGGSLRWVKNIPDASIVAVSPVGAYVNFYTNGFTNTLTITSKAYVQPVDIKTMPLLTLTTGTIAFEGGNLTGVHSQVFKLLTNNTTQLLSNNIVVKIPTDPALAKLAIAFDAKSGLLKGTFTNAISLKPLTFFGAVVQPDNTAYGYFVDPAATAAGANTNTVGSTAITPLP